jgi:hypothetical protein
LNITREIKDWAAQRMYSNCLKNGLELGKTFASQSTHYKLVRFEEVSPGEMWLLGNVEQKQQSNIHRDSNPSVIMCASLYSYAHPNAHAMPSSNAANSNTSVGT